MPDPFSESLIIESEEETTLRMDCLLKRRFPSFSRNYFQYLIAARSVLLNGKPIKKKDKASIGDELEILFLHLPEIQIEPQNIPLEILYEDDHILCINKPAGMVVHPAPGHTQNTLVNALLYHVKNNPFDKDDLRPGIVHRLDKDTSGVLIAAKTPRTHQALVDSFIERKVKKEYLAICIGSPKEGMLKTCLGRDPKDRKKIAVAAQGKEALTEFFILEHAHPLSLVLAKPITGRTHQIRVHLTHLNAPILGDALYGSTRFNKTYKAERQLLHAYNLSLPHPITGEIFHCQAPLPADIKKYF